eukprot:TRINITY_DN2433_c0_g1_i1.p1 TRINITY_DN2433_c0_g1~~TRINITY_DN2433_c0_g1_i1.p1  ORF type:complete len:149 (-),score=29.94 TRINITY_DN2433_c0_g1_i1:32-478(-)
MASNLTHEQVAEYREAFMTFDRDMDGKINLTELAIIMRSLGYNPSERELVEIMNTVDTDASGTVEFSEFLAMMAKKVREADSAEDLKKAFRFFDKDKTGKISAYELKNILTTMGEPLSIEDADKLIEVADRNKDGEIDYEEFVNFMMQ